MTSQKPFVVGLAGGSGSGKTTLATIIAENLPWDVTTVPMDQFYQDLSHLSFGERKKVNFDLPESIDTTTLVSVVQSLTHGHPTKIPVYDFALYNRSLNTELLSPAPVILVEGMHALHHLPLVALYDLSVFLDIDEATRWERKLERDIRDRDRTYEDVLRMWKAYTQPMHNKHVQPTRHRGTLLFTDTFAPNVIQAITQEIQKKVDFRNNSSSIF